ncbi:hypothetical protein LCGC14_1823020 [marine sediment metagenome]|uniref:Uncharacterized protein n=1 Tax=marine sediment metagenome TaxID=412755 RepID=A0A0F9GIF7_9ZZZZ
MSVSLPRDEKNGTVQVTFWSDVQHVDIGATATTIANAIQSNVVRIVSTTDCHVLRGSLATAATTDTFMPANVPEYIAVAEGVDLISAIATNTATGVAGTLYVTECS